MSEGRIEFRDALPGDLPTIMGLLADDEIATARGGYSDEVDPGAQEAFAEIERDPNNRLLVGDRGGEVVAVLQLTVIPGLSRGGMRRGLIEAVRVRHDLRSMGVGAALVQAAVLTARRAGCGLVQLTTDKRRRRAHDFYARLGFVASHEGMKLVL